MKLNPDNNTSHNDYINASYINVSFTTPLLILILVQRERREGERRERERILVHSC